MSHKWQKLGYGLNKTCSDCKQSSTSKTLTEKCPLLPTTGGK